ncbi:Uncharacterised protein [uncultured Clostridium sp.]|nr:Uncharacterised protein [uncultured Clostridium sp.]
MAVLQSKEAICKRVDEAVQNVWVTDVHTHLYPPSFGDILLWNVDELLTYHYLVAETFRYIDMDYDAFWALSKREQADLIFKTLFIDHSPISESCRGVLTVLQKLGLDLASRDLAAWREYFDQLTVEDYTDKVFELGRIKRVVMTNDPFDDLERPHWEKPQADARFLAALRIDQLLLHYPENWEKIKGWGYDVDAELSIKAVIEVQRFLRDWAVRMQAQYMAASLPPAFKVPDNTLCARLVEQAVLPVCREMNIPFAMMIGVKKLSNPDLQLAGDSEGKGDIDTVEYLCRTYPHNKFLCTMLARENQHELAVAARKFRNLLVFGCWWFLNNPSLIEEMTRMRIELLGLSVVPQHSDARVLDQLIYKWTHSRRIIAKVLRDKYCDLYDTGWRVTDEEIDRDVDKLFGGAFDDFLALQL